jgi:tetratricopeptide (TPR) repeat protein
MRNWFVPLFFAGLLLCVSAEIANAQRRPPENPFVFGNPEAANVTNYLYGDFKVEDRTSGGQKPLGFNIVLLTNYGREFMRQNVSVNGRYAFSNVPNGEYYIVVEMTGAEVARLQVRLGSLIRSEIRRDIELEWRDNSFKATNTEIVTAKDGYRRSPANQKLFDKAQEAISKKDHKQAMALLGQVTSADAKDFPAWVSLGTIQFIEQQPADAEKSFRNALAAKDDLRMAALGLGKAQMMQKNFDGAIETLTKAVETDPNHAEAQFLLGESYLQIKKGSKAVGYLNEAVRLDPMGMAEAHLRLGTLYRGAGLKEKAVAEFELYLAKRPDYSDKEKLQQYINENKPK